MGKDPQFIPSAIGSSILMGFS
ncbi:hypothetical protein LINPERHAP2_LOCUS12103 [Linum perenne]